LKKKKPEYTMANYNFLSEVAKEYSIPIDKLENRVHEVFGHWRLKEIEHDQDTEHFKRFVGQHEFKIVDTCAVVLYLKLLETERFNRCVSFDLNAANKRIGIIKKVMLTTGLTLAVLSLFLRNNSCL